MGEGKGVEIGCSKGEVHGEWMRSSFFTLSP